MQQWRLHVALLFVLLMPWSLFLPAHGEDETPQLYVVYLGQNEHKSAEATHAHHHQLLSNIFDSQEKISKAVVYHYKHGFSGFSALITPAQAEALSELPEVVSVFRSQKSWLHTTRSWTYLGLDERSGVWVDAKFGEDLIVGVFDSGIWPESASFRDTSLPPIPARWKGKCSGDSNFSSSLCNKKLIGTKYFVEGYAAEHPVTSTGMIRSVRDTDGHGTHTASTIAGARVDNASFVGLAKGTATGGAPSAKIAVYKVCWEEGCSDADTLAAFDEAVKDGVDVISLSLGASSPTPLSADATAIGAFHATMAGILVCQSAGNLGPQYGTVTSVAPWVLTVAASSMGRGFQSKMVLGDGTVLGGYAVNVNTDFEVEEKGLIEAENSPAPGSTSGDSRQCFPGSLDSQAVSGKVIVCENNGGMFGEDDAVIASGGYGFIVVNNNFSSASYPFDRLYGRYQQDIVGAGVDDTNAALLKNYVAKFRRNATVTVQHAETVQTVGHSAEVAEFSSRGPNLIFPYVLKPDVTAPGVNILAAWTGVTEYPFKIVSGTSMSCPHVAAAALLVKAHHPKWTPAAIKSALMTTATPLRNGNIMEFGAGEINIKRAVDPGLIYDLTIKEYLDFLCGGNLSSKDFEILAGGYACPTELPSPWNLNYPAIIVKSNNSATRRVTKVGGGVATYRTVIFAPSGFEVRVVPSELMFHEEGEAQSFTVSVKGTASSSLPITGALMWTDGFHNVTSMIHVVN